MPHPFRLLDLSLELRRVIFHEYLATAQSSIQESEESFVYGNIISETGTIQVPLLAASKQIYWEVRGLLRTTNAFSVRVSWQDMAFDAWSSFLLKMQDHKLDYGNIAHLKILIYPVLDGRDTDTLHIWGKVKQLCDDLRKFPRIPGLTVHFQEDGVDRCWIEGYQIDYARDTFRSAFEDFAEDTADATHILDLFATLTNVDRARMILPESLNDYELLLRMQDSVVKIMTGQQDPSQAFENLVEEMESKICCNEDMIQRRAGEWAVAELWNESRLKRKSGAQARQFVKTHPCLRTAEE
ncbi:MAG: hypothetical protein Q9173_000418 [Seirophora scorigena]